MSFPESDWKRLRTIRVEALERYCRQVLDECHEILHGTEGSAHDRYLRLFELMRERDAQLAGAFDDNRRSTAIINLIAMRRLGLISDQELEGFSSETQERVAAVETS